MHYHLTMLAARTLPWLLMLCSCLHTPLTPGPLEVQNSAEVDIGAVYAVFEQVEALVEPAVDLSGYTIEVLPTWEASNAACLKAGGPEGVIGCTSIGLRHIIVPWPLAREGWTEPQIYGASAAILAHELGHVYYTQTEADSDHEHVHKEWFYLADRTSVTGRVYDIFAGEIYQ